MNKYLVVGLLLLGMLAAGVFYSSKFSTAPDGGTNFNFPILNSTNTAGSVYFVQPGETIEDIAQRFGVSPNTILQMNGLAKNSQLQVGEQLIISPTAGIFYTVRQGDTLESIAKRFDSKSDDIRTFNTIGDNSLIIGSQIIIPHSLP